MSRIGSLASDTAVYGVFTIIGRFLTFLLTPIYTNYLTKQELGDIIYIYSILAFLNVIYSFGMESAYFRFFNKNQEGKKAFSHSFLTIGFISLILSIILFTNSEFLGSLVSDSENAYKLIQLAAFIPFLDALILIPYAYLRMTRKAKKFALTRFILIVIAVILNLNFVIFFDLGANGVLTAQLIASIIGVVIFLGLIIKHLEFKIDRYFLKEMLYFGLPTVPAGISSIILQVIDRPLLKELTGSSEQLAIYGTNYRLGITMMLLVTVFEYAWKPFYLSRFEDKDAKELFSRVFTFFTVVAAIVFLLTSLFIEYIVQMPFVGGRFINPDYWEGLGIIPIILFAYYLNGMFTNFSAGFLIMKKTKFLPIAVASAAFVKIALNFILVPKIGYWGSAWATLAAYAVSAIIIFLYSRKIYPIKYEWTKIIIIILFCFFAYTISKSFSFMFSMTYAILFKFFVICIFVYILNLSKIFLFRHIKEIGKIFKKG